MLYGGVQFRQHEQHSKVLGQMLKAPQLKSLVGHCGIVDKSSACGAKVPGGGKIIFQ